MRVSPVDCDFTCGEFWRRVPAWERVTKAQFGDHRWQQTHSILSVDHVEAALGGMLSSGLIANLRAGLERTPMRVRIFAWEIIPMIALVLLVTSVVITRIDRARPRNKKDLGQGRRATVPETTRQPA